MAGSYRATSDRTETDCNRRVYLFDEKNIVTLVKHEMMMALHVKKKFTNEKCIVWKTTAWRRTSHLGQYCTVQINNSGFPLLEEAKTCNIDGVTDKEEDAVWMKFIREKLSMNFTSDCQTGDKCYKMNLNIYLVHVLFFKKLGHFALREYNIASMRNIMKSEYFIENRLGTIVRQDNLVKTAIKSLKNEEKESFFATKCQNYNFQSTMSRIEVQNVYESKGYNGLLCVLEKELNYDIISFLIEMKEEHVRYVTSYAEVVLQLTFVLYVFPTVPNRSNSD